MKAPTNPNDGHHEVMALRRNSWGRGPDAKSALKQLKLNDSRPGAVRYVIVPKGACIDGFGLNIAWDTKNHPDERCEHCTY